MKAAKHKDVRQVQKVDEMRAGISTRLPIAPLRKETRSLK